MNALPQLLNIPPPMTRPSFWLYVWRVTTDTGRDVLYVGRTGDGTFPTANPPIFRMGQHLEPNGSSNQLLKRLDEQNIDPSSCTAFQLVAYGPLFLETKDRNEHYRRRDVVAALESALHDALLGGHYTVIDHSSSRKPLCRLCWQEVWEAFQEHFDAIAPYPHKTIRPNYVCFKHS